MAQIYFDNSATTALGAPAREGMLAAMDNYANPSSVHAQGLQAARLLSDCRAVIGEALGERFLREGQLIFTASGTEANAIALLGTARAKERRAARTILTTDSEHPSVARNLALLEREGYRIVRVSTRGGSLDMDTVRAHCNADLFAVSMMLVNNETGAIYPVADVFAAARAANPTCICHCDAVQAFMKVPFTAKSLGADLISVSAHKVHGPKGVGALFVAPRLHTARAIAPIYEGGGQEQGLRSGTENTVGIAGFAAAVRAAMPKRGANASHTAALTQRIIDGLAGSEITCNLPERRAGHILNITLPDIKSETMLHFLSGKGIAVSAGSACSSHGKGGSSTLIAFGLDAAQADCALRISLCADNTAEEIDALLAALAEGVATLVRIHR